MKRIILGLSLVLMLVQNGFGYTDAEWDEMIAYTPMKVNKLIARCNKEGLNHKYYGDPKVCIEAFDMIQEKYPNERTMMSKMLNNAGFLYNYSKKNYIKAYEYYMKATRLGNTTAQRNLDKLCREHSWVRK